MLTELQIQEITATLQSCPLDIKNRSIELIGLKQSLADLEAIWSYVKSKIANDIFDEKNEAGKPRYSNEEKRNWELNNRLSLYADYVKFQESSKKAKRDIQDKEIELEFIKNKFSATKALVQVLTNA